MRPIRFRAWDATEKKMWYPVAVQCGDEPCGMFVSLIYQSDHQNDPLMQFTGLHDKNGREIYEGDIIQYDKTTSRSFRREVSFHEGSFAYQDLVKCWVNLGDRGREFSVIGNRWENPELLNVGGRP